MNPSKKDNSWQGFHGSGQHDSGGGLGSYKSFDDNSGRNWKKIIIIGIVLLSLISLIGLYSTSRGSSGPKVTEIQLSIESVIKSQSTISNFIDEYEAGLTSGNPRAISAHIDAINSSGYSQLNSYLSENYVPSSQLAGEVPTTITEIMDRASSTGNFDQTYNVQLGTIIDISETQMQSLLLATQSSQLKSILVTSLDSLGTVELID